MASWKLTLSDLEEDKIEYTSFLECRKYFAVDDSTSTRGSVLHQERSFVESFRKSYPNTADAISLWGKKCDNPTTQFESVQWRSSHRGTYPSDILNNTAALKAIKQSDAWFLLTDGEIYNGDVHRLADLAYDAEVLNVPLIFLITGARGSSPGTANISVGISFFASSHDTLILFKDKHTGRIYVIAGKGCFAELGGSAAAQNLAHWNDLVAFASEAEFFSHCQKSHIRIARSESRAKSNGGISLGAHWEGQHVGVKVDVDLLLSSGTLTDMDAIDLLADEAFGALAIACKTRRRIPDLRAFVQAQKIEQVAPKLEDRNGAAVIIAKMSDTCIDEKNRKALQEQLRKAHARNRQDYLKVVTEFAGSAAEQTLKKRNQLVDAALRSLASIDAASYNVQLLDRRSNRARRAEAVHPSSRIDMAQLDLEAPSCRGYCLICCDDDVIMSIAFKETAPEHMEDNTSDFALNFPLAAGASQKNVDLISSQNICFQCALLGYDGMSMYKERLTAVIPAIQFAGNNKKYITDQLYTALTAKLATGAAGVAQLFMSILQNVMRTKSWAGAGLSASERSADEYSEVEQRQKTFQWMLNQLIQNTVTRETFKEDGAWVDFSQALTWVAKDFESSRLASFAITYPMAGFNSLVAVGQQTGTFSNETIRQLHSAKALYSIAAKYLAELQVVLQRGSANTSTDCEGWKQKYLELIYCDFNAPLIPTDHGEASILDDTKSFNQRLTSCLTEIAIIDKPTMQKIQILVFWLLFTQRVHCTAQTLFTRITHDFPLGATVLSSTVAVPSSEHKTILLSIFATHNAVLINPIEAAAHDAVIPFANPLGPSVLRCGVPSCHHPFVDISTLRPQHVTTEAIEAIRAARAAHLKDVFGIRGRFEGSATGLPERTGTAAGQPPSSVHVNLHISVAREWASRTYDAKRRIVEDEATARREFLQSVRRRVCVDGRGNVLSATIEKDAEALLPSFFEAIKAGMRVGGWDGEDVASYELDFERRKLVDKVVWELMAEPRQGELL